MCNRMGVFPWRLSDFETSNASFTEIDLKSYILKIRSKHNLGHGINESQFGEISIFAMQWS